MAQEKEIRWVGSAYEDLLNFPMTLAARRDSSWARCKPHWSPTTGSPSMKSARVHREIRFREASGAWRVMYVAKFEEAVFVLHCFQKKTQATSRRNKVIAETRYRAVVNMRKVGK